MIESIAIGMFITSACALAWLGGYIMGRQHGKDRHTKE